MLAKTIIWLLLLIVATLAQARPLSMDGKGLGVLDGELKVLHILHGESNGYDPNEGTAYLLSLKYQSEELAGARLHAGYYLNGNFLGLTDFSVGPPDDLVGRGMFVRDEGERKGQLGELFATWNGDSVSLSLGRQQLDTPLTTILDTTIPNFYTAGIVKWEPIERLSLSAGVITQLSYGARAITDFGLIGEGTPTGGAALNPNSIDQAHFHDIATATLGKGAPDTDGIWLLNASYAINEDLGISVWNYHVDDIANNLYAEAQAGFPARFGKFRLEGQFLRQRDAGASVLPFGLAELDFTLVGVKLGLSHKQWSVYAAYNDSTGDTYMLNGWGGDPAYTSTLFSRNAYRQDVEAYKVGASYKPLKNINLQVGYANYGRSRTKGFGGKLLPVSDADEFDFIAAYKPRKDLMFKVFYAGRTSEYDGAGGKDRTMSHWRLIASYQFF